MSKDIQEQDGMNIGTYIHELRFRTKMYFVFIMMLLLIVTALVGILFNKEKHCKEHHQDKVVETSYNTQWNTDWSVAELRAVTNVRPLYLAMYND